MPAVLKSKFDKDISKFLEKEIGRKNLLSLPHLVKISVNIGVGSQVTRGEKDFSHVQANLANITGQQPNVRKARKAISNFKLREGLPVGLTSTLRGSKMYDFFERLVNVALPRVRDFQGIPVNGFDGKGNFSMGLKDVTIFPEVNPDSLAKGHGLQVNICTSAKNDHEAYLLLKALGFPFKGEVTPSND